MVEAEGLHREGNAIMKIALGTDHAGFHYKEEIKSYLEEHGHEVQDFGTFSDTSVDYPLFIRPAAASVVFGGSDRAIVLGGSGNGEAMVANRIPGVRCALCWSEETARLARQHNDANVISLGARTISLEDALKIVEIWLETPFEGGRHVRRIRQIDEPESTQGTGSEKKTAAQKTGTETSVPAPSQKWDLLIAFRYLKYMEGKEALEFQVDPSLKGPSIVHVASEERWKSEMPEWAKDRREEILERIKEKCTHMECEWRDY
jgi:ribose 5-phosphate isomerase B